MIDVLVDQRGEQVIGQRDGVGVAREMQFDVFHRHDLRETAAGRAAFHPEHRADQRLAQADDGVASDVVQGVAQVQHRCRLAFAGGRRRNRADADQLAGRLVVRRGDAAKRQSVLPVVIGRNLRVEDRVTLVRRFDDAAQRSGPCDLEVAARGQFRTVIGCEEGFDSTWTG